MPKVAFVLLLLAMLCQLIFVGDITRASIGTDGTLTSDTTWTPAQSPIRLTGTVTVNPGVTLTIEPGVTVDVREFHILVEGTLIARGTSQNKIIFTTTADKNDGLHYPDRQPYRLNFYRNASLEQKIQSTSIIENAIITEPINIIDPVTIAKSSLQGAVIIDGNSAELSENDLSDVHILNGSPILNNNTITDVLIPGGTPTFVNNTIKGRVLSAGVSPVFLGNTFFDGITVSNGQCTITNNEFKPTNDKTIIKAWGTYENISNNTIIGNNKSQIGIDVAESASMPFYFDLDSGLFKNNWINVKPGTASINGNNIYNCLIGISTHYCDAQISNNLVSNNYLGVTINSSYYRGATDNNTVVIYENTIENNSIGIGFSSNKTTANITNNEIYGNINYNLQMDSSKNITVTNNCWGTTDSNAINQSIYDYKNDPSLGRVTFMPFSTAPYAQSSTTANEPSQPTSTNGSLPKTSNTPVIIAIALVILIFVIAVVIVVSRKIKNRSRQTISLDCFPNQIYSRNLDKA